MILTFSSTIPILLALSIAIAPTRAQQLGQSSAQNPIYIADSPIASESLVRLAELLAQGNLDEASRLVDMLITELGGRLIESDNQGIYIPVRQRLHQVIQRSPSLLETYRTRTAPVAQTWLDSDEWKLAYNNAWLTTPGFVASLRYTQTLLESAHFYAALRVIDQLQAHPDATTLAPSASKVATQIARYINTPGAWAIADQWSARADRVGAEHTPIASPRVDNHISASSLDWDADRISQSVSLDGIVAGPLSQALLTPEYDIELTQDLNQPRNSGANWNPTPWTQPVVDGNFLYTNDGITISCFDRFTLRPIWRNQTAIDATDIPTNNDARARLGRIIEDSTTLSIQGHDLYVPSGIPRGGDRAGDNRVIKLDAQTGQIKWAKSLLDLDPTLIDASIRGPIVVDQGVVVVGARTNNRRQRLISFTALGLDAQTGNLLWIQPIGSAGLLPFQQMGQLAHHPITKEGVVYWTDHIGLGFAIESATGYVRWARALPPPDLYARFTRPSYANNTPIITDQGLFVLSTDGTKLLQLDATTGVTLASRAAEPVGESLYLLDAHDFVASVSAFQISFYPKNHFETGVVTRSATLGGSSGITGRVIQIGDKLLAPVTNGVVTIDPTIPMRTRTIELDATGNILALDGQILVVDHLQVTSFLSWETASALLYQRIPQDPGAAITLAELAYRAQRFDETRPAIERALKEIKSVPSATRQELSDQLYAVILDMVEPAQREQSPAIGADPLTPAKNLSSQDQLALLNHLSTLARTHQQVLAQRMAQGAWHELRSDPQSAIGAYQDILDQPTLGASMWEGNSIAVRGGLEATRRIGNILAAQGYLPYRKFDQLAATERNYLLTPNNTTDSTTNQTPSITQLETLAKRYPWSTSTPSIWAETARLYASTNQTPASIRAATQGLDIARSLSKLGVNTPQDTIDLLAQRAISGMINTNRASDAQSLAISLVEQFPNLTLRIEGRIVTHEEIAQANKAKSQMPALGDQFIRDDQPVLLTGSPIKPTTRIDRGGVVLYAPQLGRASYVRAGRNVFEEIWSRSALNNEPPMIPWQDESRTLLLWPEGSQTQDTGSLDAIETTTGKSIWTRNNIRATLAEQSDRIPDDIARVDAQFNTPVKGPVPINQLVIVTDGHTVIVSDRIGRATGIDLFSGQTLWSADLPVNRLYDMDLAGGVLGICGIMYTDRAIDQQQGTITSIVASIDPRTGQTIQTLDRFGQSPRWVRAGFNGNLFVATSQRIVAMNTKEGTIDWILSDEDMIETYAGWISADQLIVLDENADLWSLNLTQGTRSTRPLETRSRLLMRSWAQVQSMLGSTVVAGPGGLAIFDHTQELIACDSINQQSRMIDVAWGSDRAVFLELPNRDNEQTQTSLHLLATHDARLLDSIDLVIPRTIDRTPDTITAINGGVIVGYNEVSIFVRTTFPTQ